MAINILIQHNLTNLNFGHFLLVFLISFILFFPLFSSTLKHWLGVFIPAIFSSFSFFLALPLRSIKIIQDISSMGNKKQKQPFLTASLCLAPVLFLFSHLRWDFRGRNSHSFFQYSHFPSTFRLTVICLSLYHYEPTKFHQNSTHSYQ